jgi:transcriptional regulator with XRE-family HTH domain
MDGISAAQCRAARALLAWSQDQLVKRAKITKKTIADFERGATKPYPSTMTAIRVALEAAGIEFLPDNGVRLQREPLTARGEP